MEGRRHRPLHHAIGHAGWCRFAHKLVRSANRIEKCNHEPATGHLPVLSEAAMKLAVALRDRLGSDATLEDFKAAPLAVYELLHAAPAELAASS